MNDDYPKVLQVLLVPQPTAQGVVQFLVAVRDDGALFRLIGAGSTTIEAREGTIVQTLVKDPYWEPWVPVTGTEAAAKYNEETPQG